MASTRRGLSVITSSGCNGKPAPGNGAVTESILIPLMEKLDEMKTSLLQDIQSARGSHEADQRCTEQKILLLQQMLIDQTKEYYRLQAELIFSQQREGKTQEEKKEMERCFQSRICELETRVQDSERLVTESESAALVANEKLLHREAEVMDLKRVLTEKENEIEVARQERDAARQEAQHASRAREETPGVNDALQQPAAKRSRLEEARQQRRVSFVGSGPSLAALAELEEIHKKSNEMAKNSTPV